MCIPHRGHVSTEPLPRNDRGIHIQTIEMGSGAMIYVPSFIKIGSGIQKLMGGGDTQTAM
jgi:hypothetical protein